MRQKAPDQTWSVLNYFATFQLWCIVPFIDAQSLNDMKFSTVIRSASIWACRLHIRAVKLFLEHQDVFTSMNRHNLRPTAAETSRSLFWCILTVQPCSLLPEKMFASCPFPQTSKSTIFLFPYPCSLIVSQPRLNGRSCIPRPPLPHHVCHSDPSPEAAFIQCFSLYIAAKYKNLLQPGPPRPQNEPQRPAHHFPHGNNSNLQ